MADSGSDGGADADADADSDSDSDADADADAADGVALTPREVMGPAWSSAVSGVAYNLRGVVPGASRASFGSDTFGGVAEAAAATAAAAAAAAETRFAADARANFPAAPRAGSGVETSAGELGSLGLLLLLSLTGAVDRAAVVGAGLMWLVLQATGG